MNDKQGLLEAEPETGEIIEATETAITAPLSVATLEKVIVGGDLSGLDAAQRTEYYLHMCARADIDPASRPFEFIKLNGKLVLYAKRDCTDQLRMRHGVSVVEMSHIPGDKLYVVTVKVQNARGRMDMATGAVNIAGLQPEALANAIMKAETKAKRRATLSICGLGLLDESEVAVVPAGGGTASDAQEKLRAFLEGQKPDNGNKNGGGNGGGANAQPSRDEFIAAMKVLSDRDLSGWGLSTQDCGALYRAGAEASGLKGGKEVAAWIADNATLGLVEGEGGEVLGVQLNLNQKVES